jgi:diphosphomevalonate decarboxylase
MKNEIISAKGRGPINIALIKYWGKEDEEKIIPLNNSISLTLDMSNFYTETTINLYPDIQTGETKLTINDKYQKTKLGKKK